MEKVAYFFIDDVIWVMRDIARERPASLFDNGFMKMLKKAHDEWGLTVQLNLFYRTDFFYGNEEFTLSDMPDIYKPEFEAASDWLKMAFHAKQEFPDYPYVNATYEDVKDNYELVVGEIKRFAGEKSVSVTLCPHWLPVSKAGCHALYDCGVKFVSPSTGDTKEFDGDDDCLPYGHSFRLRQNRQPETKLCIRAGKNTRIANSICGYNHVSTEIKNSYFGKNTSHLDEETGLRFRQLGGGPTLNLHSLEEIDEALDKLNDGREFIGCATHEQYYYPHYYAYQPDYAEKIYLLARKVTEFGYRWITAEEFK